MNNMQEMASYLPTNVQQDQEMDDLCDLMNVSLRHYTYEEECQRLGEHINRLASSSSWSDIHYALNDISKDVERYHNSFIHDIVTTDYKYRFEIKNYYDRYMVHWIKYVQCARHEESYIIRDILLQLLKFIQLTIDEPDERFDYNDYGEDFNYEHNEDFNYDESDGYDTNDEMTK